jgi:predicted SAM-dependent methyltransferase
MLTILNLGCGTRTSPMTVNIDFSIYQRLRASNGGRTAAKLLLKGERRARFDAMSDNIVVHNLRKGIPAESNSVDAVYHSHTLEHIDRADVPGFMSEVLRVLKPGGIHRIVVPDLEQVVRVYLADLEAERDNHDSTIEPFLEQAVRRAAFGTSEQAPLRQWIENLLLGDARRRGETHQWMYDSLNLAQMLEANGFTDICCVDEKTSAIPGWDEIGLDVHDDGSPYKPGSLWMEATKSALPS